MPGSVLGGLGCPVNAATNHAHACLSPQNGALVPSGSTLHVKPFEPARSSVVVFFFGSIRTTAARAEMAAGAPDSASLTNWALLNEGSKRPPTTAGHSVGRIEALLASGETQADAVPSYTVDSGPQGG